MVDPKRVGSYTSMLLSTCYGMAKRREHFAFCVRESQRKCVCVCMYVCVCTFSCVCVCALINMGILGWARVLSASLPNPFCHTHHHHHKFPPPTPQLSPTPRRCPRMGLRRGLFHSPPHPSPNSNFPLLPLPFSPTPSASLSSL